MAGASLGKTAVGLAGPRDVVDEKPMWGASNQAAFQRKMAAQAA